MTVTVTAAEATTGAAGSARRRGETAATWAAETTATVTSATKTAATATSTEAITASKAAAGATTAPEAAVASSKSTTEATAAEATRATKSTGTHRPSRHRLGVATATQTAAETTRFPSLDRTASLYIDLDAAILDTDAITAI